MEDAARQALELKQMEAEDRSDLADVRTAGVGATVPGGHPTQMGGGPIPMLTKPEEAQAFADARIAEGSDYVKIIQDDGRTWPWPLSERAYPTNDARSELRSMSLDI